MIELLDIVVGQRVLLMKPLHTGGPQGAELPAGLLGRIAGRRADGSPMIDSGREAADLVGVDWGPPLGVVWTPRASLALAAENFDVEHALLGLRRISLLLSQLSGWGFGEPPIPAAWGRVTDDTERLPVPGGWLYRTRVWGIFDHVDEPPNVALCFVAEQPRGCTGT